MSVPWLPAEPVADGARRVKAPAGEARPRGRARDRDIRVRQTATVRQERL
jgi:hypothetical protein